MEFPVSYYVGAKFVPHYSDHIVEASIHIIPENEDYIVQDTKIDQSFEDANFHKIYNNDHGKSIIMSLKKANGRKGFN